MMFLIYIGVAGVVCVLESLSGMMQHLSALWFTLADRVCMQLSATQMELSANSSCSFLLNLVQLNTQFKITIFDYIVSEKKNLLNLKRKQSYSNFVTEFLCFLFSVKYVYICQRVASIIQKYMHTLISQMIKQLGKQLTIFYYFKNIYT